MSWTTYTTVNGQILHQDKDGVGTHLIPDTLGNIIATIDEAGTVTSRTEYLPYGEIEATSGIADVSFQHLGTAGLYTDSALVSYFMYKFYTPSLSQWMTSTSSTSILSSYAFVPKAFLPIDTLVDHCLWRTKTYCEEAIKTGRAADRCICIASGILCAIMSKAHWSLTLMPPCIAQWLNCMNRSMFQCWSSSTPEWSKKERVCNDCHATSKDCCNATVNAEQNCYTRAFPACYGVGCRPPFPFPWDKVFNAFPIGFLDDEPTRQAQARNFCCSFA